MKRLAGPLALFLLAPLAAADFITGFVVDSNGVPVAGVNIDAIRVSNGNNINLANDGTDAAGHFLTTIPADVYDLWFFPPTPPASSHVTLVLRNVIVAGTKDLGTLHLQAGSLVSGHVQTQAGVPVNQLDLVMIDQATGFPVPLANRRTDAFGNFLVAAPKNAIELDLDATSVLPAPVLGSKALQLTPTVDTNLGTIVLPPGFFVTGHVQRASNGLAVAGVDLDFKDLVNGGTLYTPNDNSDATGNYSVVVPAGTYHVDFSPPRSTNLAGKRVASQVISANTALPVVALDTGVLLSGTIRSAAGVAQVNADVDVYDQASGTLIPTSGDNSSATGAYSVIVPLGNLEVVFRPPSYTVPLVSDVHANFLVSTPTTLNGALPAWPAPNNYGTGTAGLGGFVPHAVVSGGTSRTGNPDFAFDVTGGRGGALSVLTVSLQSASIPHFGGTILVRPGAAYSVTFPVRLDGATGVAGAGTKHLVNLFALGQVENLDLYAQWRIRDTANPSGWTLSDAVHFKVFP